MSGHSKWSTIKRKKGAADAKRGKIFSRLAKEITIAAKIGGGDPDANPRLRTALLSARAQNVPKDNVDRAIKRGTGELPGVTYEEIRYEGYGPGGVALIMDVLTDNKNRIVGELRHVLSKNHGSMAENGAVTWNFDPKGQIVVQNGGLSDEDLLEKAIEAGADDVEPGEESSVVYTEPTELQAVSDALGEAGLTVEEAKLVMVPKTTTQLEGKDAQAVLRLMEALEDLDDVQDLFSNFDISDEEMAAALSE
jgi:YebC/PmpR family DNA-binding regulatory protein